MMDMKCEFIFPAVKSEDPQSQGLTVGDVFYAGCTASENINTQKLAVKIDEKEKYKIKLLSYEKQDDKWVFKFTSYLPGKHKWDNIELDADGQSINLGPVEFAVGSVLNPQEKQEAFGPFAGIPISIPLLYWLLLIMCLLSFISFVSGYFLVRWKRKKMLLKLEEYEVATNPLQQFYATYRKVQRENSFFHLQGTISAEMRLQFLPVINEIEKGLKLYLLRKFKTPALEKKWSSTVKDLTHFHSEFMSYQKPDLLEIIKELEKAKQAVETLKVKDLVQIFERIRLFIEFSENLQEALRRKDRVYLKKLRSLKA